MLERGHGIVGRALLSDEEAGGNLSIQSPCRSFSSKFGEIIPRTTIQPHRRDGEVKLLAVVIAVFRLPTRCFVVPPASCLLLSAMPVKITWSRTSASPARGRLWTSGLHHATTITTTPFLQLLDAHSIEIRDHKLRGDPTFFFPLPMRGKNWISDDYLISFSTQPLSISVHVFLVDFNLGVDIRQHSQLISDKR